MRMTLNISKKIIIAAKITGLMTHTTILLFQMPDQGLSIISIRSMILSTTPFMTLSIIPHSHTDTGPSMILSLVDFTDLDLIALDGLRGLVFHWHGVARSALIGGTDGIDGTHSMIRFSMTRSSMIRSSALQVSLDLTGLTGGGDSTPYMLSIQTVRFSTMPEEGLAEVLVLEELRLQQPTVQEEVLRTVQEVV